MEWATQGAQGGDDGQEHDAQDSGRMVRLEEALMEFARRDTAAEEERQVRGRVGCAVRWMCPARRPLQQQRQLWPIWFG